MALLTFIGIGTQAPRQQVSIGPYLDIYSGGFNDPTRASVRASSANNLVLSAIHGGAVFVNHDSGSGGIRFHDGTPTGEVMRITGSGSV